MTNIDLPDFISKYPRNQRDNLIPILQDIQDRYGYLPGEALSALADYLGLPVVKIYSVATYYNQFCFEKRGRFHLQVCGGMGCHLDGSSRVLRELKKILEIEDGGMTRDQLFSLEVVPCLGACHLAPVISINGRLYGQLSSRDLSKLLDKLRSSGDEEL